LTPDRVRELQKGSCRGSLVIRDFLILFSVKRELWIVFFVIRDLEVLRDPRKT